MDSSTAGSGALPRELLEDGVLGGGAALLALALRDIGEAAAHEPAAAARQAQQAHVAHEFLAERIPMQPFEVQRARIERALDAQTNVHRARRRHPAAAAD